MAKKRDYSYAQAPGSRHGPMICSVCGKEITSGMYSVYETTDAYVPQHRACTPGNPEWARVDQRDEEYRVHISKFLGACVEFKFRWGVDELDDVISELRDEQRRTEK